MALALEDFALSEAGPLQSSDDRISTTESETARMNAYEQGYKAGWDDAVRSETEEQARIGTELARHLKEMSFGFHEARTHILKAMEPLLEELIGNLLPTLVRDSLGPRIVETLEPLIADCADSPVHIAVAPDSEALLRPHLEASGISEFDLVEEVTLSDGQAFLRVGRIERKIDLTQALEEIAKSVRALSDLNERAIIDG
ncbi:ABC transporter, ATP-binding protein, flagellar [Candidatus Rhodobacter oscarellae]|uniref:ABC transporter, ATP-binding protein, flagellar n=1 Tax=Candidatus Rhodobacter oscarellae TaxID=1675527 RepID=A0A0J9EBF2_9RHOB|nr:hypothetical protein [Candidatus Rhodobacter lobularis]KMW59024.1 ABC transporter, ATP-binding protein, flagellar [Candidatus Rhodobacter lobularis]